MQAHNGGSERAEQLPTSSREAALLHVGVGKTMLDF
jgi:hypothetical protein